LPGKQGERTRISRKKKKKSLEGRFGACNGASRKPGGVRDRSSGKRIELASGKGKREEGHGGTPNGGQATVRTVAGTKHQNAEEKCGKKGAHEVSALRWVHHEGGKVFKAQYREKGRTGEGKSGGKRKPKMMGTSQGHRKVNTTPLLGKRVGVKKKGPKTPENSPLAPGS